HDLDARGTLVRRGKRAGGGGRGRGSDTIAGRAAAHRGGAVATAEPFSPRQCGAPVVGGAGVRRARSSACRRDPAPVAGARTCRAGGALAQYRSTPVRCAPACHARVAAGAAGLVPTVATGARP